MPQQVEAKFTITATASQTSITNVSYTVGSVHVFQNGVRLVDGTDFTATNGSTVTLETGATEGDQIVIVSHGSFETGDVVSKASGGTFSSAIAVDGSITATSLVIPDGSLPLVDLDIDGGTDIGAALVDADLMIVDDGAGGTNRKATMARLATYMGTKITGGSMVFIASSGAISNAASVQFREQDGHFDSSLFDHYEFRLQAVTPATDGTALYCQTSTNDGDAYATSSGDYHHNGLTDQVGLLLNEGYPAGSDTNEFGISGTFHLLNPHLSSVYTTGMSVCTIFYTNGGIYASTHVVSAATTRVAAENTNAVKWSFNSGNIESGEIVMYGIANGT